MRWEDLNEAMTPNQTPDEVLQAYLPHYEAAMRAAHINNVRRAAAWHSQLGHESAGLRYMAEIQTDGAGWSWDRKRYRGRGPIQLTWQGNYRKFGQWCHSMGYVDDPELFVNQPELVELPRWGFLAASWYWLHGGPRAGRINEFADAGDILSVSYCVNGWRAPAMPNGWPDRKARYERCLAMGERILPSGGGQNMAISGDPVWLEDVLRAALGDRLVVHPGWKTRGTGGTMGVIWGSMIHHTGNDNERVEIIRDGVQQPSGFLRGPLSQCLITRDGKCHLIAVGPCNHAGSGNWKDLTDGNRQAIGFECSWDGDPQEWPRAMILTMRDSAAAVSKHLGKRADDSVCGHKEYAKPQGRKWDPGNFDMNWFRGEVQKDIDGFAFPGEHPPVGPPPPPPPGPPPPPTYVVPPNHTELMYDQQNGRWEMLGWRTQVEMLAEIGAALKIEGSAPGKPGFTRGPKPNP